MFNYYLNIYRKKLDAGGFKSLKDAKKSAENLWRARRNLPTPSASSEPPSPHYPDTHSLLHYPYPLYQYPYPRPLNQYHYPHSLLHYPYPYPLYLYPHLPRHPLYGYHHLYRHPQNYIPKGMSNLCYEIGNIQ